jgi:thioredoxin reductase (NADPH)
MYGAEYGNELAEALGCDRNTDGTVAVEDDGQTTVENVYAVGDGAKAGISIHFSLREFPREPEHVAEAGPVRDDEVPGIPDELLEQAVDFHTDG